MMETKTTPNRNHGCLGKALTHEPMFILLGRDQSAPAAIRRWAKSRRKMRPDEEEQISLAEQDADDFEAWRVEHDGEWRDPDAPRGVILIPTDEISSLAGHVLGRPALDDEEAAKLIDAIKTAETDEAAHEALRGALEPIEKVGHRLAGFVLNADPVAGPQDG